MAAPVGLDRARVVDAAVEVLRESGRLEAVALRVVASRLGIRIQSLYSHVDGAEGLRHALALRGLDALAHRLGQAAIGRAGGDAIEAIVRSYLDFAAEEPGLYEASLRPPGDNADLRRAVDAVMRPLNIVFETLGLDEGASIHWYRIVFASVHGFAVLRRDGLFTLPGDVEDTITHFIAVVVHQIEEEITADAGPRSRRSPAPG